MKISLISLGLFMTATIFSFAQSRVSVAPVYWYSYNKYSYTVHSVYNGSDTKASGHEQSSSVGLTARYHFTSKWDLSAGLLYNWRTTQLSNPTYPQGPTIIFTTKTIQVPIQVNYRLTNDRLSPYFSAGAFFDKSQTNSTAPVKTNGLLGIGIDYRFNSDLSLLLQPTATYLFYKPVNDPLFQFSSYVSYSVGVQTQLIWRF